MQPSKIINDLLLKYDGDTERVGFVLKTGEIVEVENVCPQPTEGFDVKGEDIVKYYDLAASTWHTHPGASNNLSVNDYQTFLNWPDHTHFIIGNDGVREYRVENGDVLICD